MAKPTRQDTSRTAPNSPKPPRLPSAPITSERKLSRDVITHLHETRERILHGRDLKTDSTETLRRFRDGGIEGTTYQGESKPPAKR